MFYTDKCLKLINNENLSRHAGKLSIHPGELSRRWNSTNTNLKYPSPSQPLPVPVPVDVSLLLLKFLSHLHSCPCPACSVQHAACRQKINKVVACWPTVHHTLPQHTPDVNQNLNPICLP